MAEEPKKKWLVKSITRRSLDELAADMEDTLNKLEEGGYSPHYEYMDRDLTGPLREQFSVMITAQLVEQSSPSPGIAAIIARLSGGGADQTKLSPETIQWYSSMLEKVSQPNYTTAMKELPSLLPPAVRSLTPTQMKKYADEIEAEADDHIKHHGGHDDEDCPVPSFMKTVARMLRENVQISIS